MNTLHFIHVLSWTIIVMTMLRALNLAALDKKNPSVNHQFEPYEILIFTSCIAALITL